MKTQHQKILEHMASDPTRWWLPQDFMRPELGELFVGYEAGARLSELAKAYPNRIESQKQGKYMARRLMPGNYEIERVKIATPEPPEAPRLFDMPVERKRFI